MPFQHIDQISEWLDGTDITLLELHGPDGSVRLVNDVSVPRIVVKAPGVGVYLDRHPLSGAELAPLGSSVSAGQTVGLLQIGVLLRPVTAPQSGRVASHLAEAGQIVGFGTAVLDIIAARSREDDS